MRRVQAHDVFLNVPFDRNYERLAVTLVAGLVCLGRMPHCVLEIPDHGQGRLVRLLALLRECSLSIHDLSRVGLPVRFNMPFELGLACAIAQHGNSHKYLLLERVRYRLDRTLSDLKGRDPYIHGRTIRGMLSCLLEALGSPTGSPPIEQIARIERDLWSYACRRRRAHRKTTIFSRQLFQEITSHAVELAAQKGIIGR